MNLKFLRFCLTGAFNTLDTALFSWLGHHFLQQNAAAVFGYVVSLTVAFFLNCRFVFREAPSFRRYAKFIFSYIPTFIIYFLVTFITLNTLHLAQFWATVLAVMAGGPVTFVIIKLYAFGNKDKQN